MEKLIRTFESIEAPEFADRLGDDLRSSEERLQVFLQMMNQIKTRLLQISNSSSN